MGVRASRFRVEARLTLLGEGFVDAIRLSRPSSAGCCGGGRRSVASFTFRREAKGGAAPLRSVKAASMNVKKLAALDQETPIRVQCLARKNSVFCQELPLRDLLAGLRITTVGSGAVLIFTLSGGLGVSEGQGQGCPVLFCNSKRVGSRPEAPQHQTQAVHVPEAGQEAGPAPQAGQVAAASPGQGAEPAPGAGQVAEASPEQEHSLASEAGQVVKASPGQDGLGVWISVPGTEGDAEEAGGAVTPAGDERWGLVHRSAGEGVAAPSPLPQRKSRQPREARQGEARAGGRVSRSQVWGALLFLGQTLIASQVGLAVLVGLAYLEEFSPG